MANCDVTFDPDLPGVQDAEDKYGQAHDALGVPPLQVGGRGDRFLRADDDDCRMILHLQGGNGWSRHLLNDAKQAGVARAVCSQTQRGSDGEWVCITHAVCSNTDREWEVEEADGDSHPKLSMTYPCRVANHLI